MQSHIDTIITALADLLEMSHDTRYQPGKIGNRSNPEFIRKAAAIGVPRKELAALVGCTPQAIGACVRGETYRNV